MALTANQRQQRYRERHPERLAESRKNFRLRHRPRLRKENRERERQRRENTKASLIAAVGGKCQGCGFADVRALHIDHVHDDGHLEVKTFRLNTVKYQRHVLAMLSSGKYQILCANCNHIKEWDRRRRSRLQ